MSVSAWSKVRVHKRKSRVSFGRRARMDGKSEFIIKVKGFSGELRRFMTDKEAEEWVLGSNKEAFLSAAKASKNGLYGFKQFTRYGEGNDGVSQILMQATAKSFSDKRSKKL